MRRPDRRDAGSLQDSSRPGETAARDRQRPRRRQAAPLPRAKHRIPACVSTLLLLALGFLSASILATHLRIWPPNPVPDVQTLHGPDISDVWILLFSNHEELSSAYRQIARVESKTGNTQYAVLFARDAAELDRAFRAANRRDRVYSLFVLSHASTGMLSYSSQGVDLRVDPSELPGGRLDPGGLGPWTDVWFYGCRFAGDDLNTTASDWPDTGRLWSRYLNGARIWGNTGWIDLHSMTGTGRWMHFQWPDTLGGR